MDLTDQHWTIIEPLFEEKRRPDGRGRLGFVVSLSIECNAFAHWAPV